MAYNEQSMHDVAGLVEQQVNKGGYPEAWTWGTLKCLKHAVPKWIAVGMSILTLIIIEVCVPRPPHSARSLPPCWFGCYMAGLDAVAVLHCHWEAGFRDMRRPFPDAPRLPLPPSATPATAQPGT